MPLFLLNQHRDRTVLLMVRSQRVLSLIFYQQVQLDPVVRLM